MCAVGFAHWLATRKLKTDLLGEGPEVMGVIIRYEDGSTTHAVIYRLIGGTLRAAVEGTDGPVDFKLIRGKWISNRGAGVTFEFPIEIGMEFLQTLTDLADSEGDGHCATGGECLIRRMAESGNNGAPN